MDNLKLPAYPTFEIDGSGSSFHGILPNGDYAWCSNPGGFTKLELASLMIAQGLMDLKLYDPETTRGVEAISTVSVHVAKAVLEEANK